MPSPQLNLSPSIYLSIQTSIIYTLLIRQGRGSPGPNPTWLWARGEVQPGQVTNLSPVLKNIRCSLKKETGLTSGPKECHYKPNTECSACLLHFIRELGFFPEVSSQLHDYKSRNLKKMHSTCILKLGILKSVERRKLSMDTTIYVRKVWTKALILPLSWKLQPPPKCE